MSILRYQDLPGSVVVTLLQRFGITLVLIPHDETIPGSYWGDTEAGIIQTTLYARSDTPLHSILHEASHIICMDEQRRQALHTDAGGDFAEEDAVCYLEIVLGDELPNVDKYRIMRDMDTWGYTFRLGSAQRWFEEDADDARQWLQQHALIDEKQRPCFRLRTTPDESVPAPHVPAISPAQPALL